MEQLSPFFMIVEERANPIVSDVLFESATATLESLGATYERVTVPNVFEIPAAVSYAIRGHEFFSGRRRFDGYIALGCVIKGDQTYGGQSFGNCLRGIQDLMIGHSLALGNGLFAAESRELAKKSAKIIGAEAAQGALDMLKLKRHFGMKPR